MHWSQCPDCKNKNYFYEEKETDPMFEKELRKEIYLLNKIKEDPSKHIDHLS